MDSQQRKPIICLDPGHGGHDSGAVGPSGLRESDVALSVALMMRELLAPVATVILTRHTDVFVPLGQRATISNDANADAFLSLHCNSGPPGRGDGFEVFTSPGPTQADLFATDVFRSYALRFPSKRKRMDLSDGDLDKEERFTVLMRTHARAALFELEFIHTHLGEAWLREKINQASAAQALAEGIRNHFSLAQGGGAREAICLHLQSITNLLSKL